MSLWSVDIEADGPCPGKYSMVSFGLVKIDRSLQTTFYGQIAPISELWIPEALAVSGHTREETLLFDTADVVMPKAIEFILQHNMNGRPIFVSDNNGFDWQFFNYYCHVYSNGNPFGHSSRRIGDFFSGLTKNFSANGRDWRKFKKTKHTHHPVMDAKGNAEALMAMSDLYGCQLNGVTPSINNKKISK